MCVSERKWYPIDVTHKYAQINQLTNTEEEEELGTDRIAEERETRHTEDEEY